MNILSVELYASDVLMFCFFFRYFFLNFCKQLFLPQGISSLINFLQSFLVRNVLNGHYSIFLHPGFCSTALQEPYPTWQKHPSLHVDFIFTHGKKNDIDGKQSLIFYWYPVCFDSLSNYKRFIQKNFIYCV